LPQIVACHKTSKVEPDRVKPLGKEPVAGVIRLGGEKTQFDAPGGLAQDTVYGQVSGVAVAIPVDSVEKILVSRRHDPMWVKPSKVKAVGDRVVAATTKDGREFRFDEVGGYVRGDTVFATRNREPLRLPLDQVQRLWIRKSDAAMNAVAGLGILVGVVGLIAIVALATKESCPFVYSWDGTRYVFDAEPYGGAISRGLERDDYARLENLKPENGLYKLLVTNEVNETQMTNIMELWVIDHPPGARVLPDLTGGLHLVSRPVPSMNARDHRGQELVSWLKTTVRSIW